MHEIFLTCTRSKGDFAGVLESDSETLYFYLYQLEASSGPKVIRAVNLTNHHYQSSQSLFEVVWNDAETIVMIHSEGKMIAAINVESVAAAEEDI